MIRSRLAPNRNKITKKVDNEVTRKSDRQAESHGSTTITVGVKVPTTALVITREV